jgi:hypothetical protein
MFYSFININQTATVFQSNSNKYWKSLFFFRCINLFLVFNDTFRIAYFLYCRMYDIGKNMRGSGCKLFYCPSICREALNKIQPAARDLNVGPLEYEAGGWSLGRDVRLFWCSIFVFGSYPLFEISLWADFCLSVCQFIYTREDDDEMRIRIGKWQKSL